MTKTPDEIKKGLECCKEDECFGDRENCPYTADPKLCVGVMCADALALIQQLQAQNAEQAERIQQLEAKGKLVEQYRWERDVAIDQLKQLGVGFGEKVNGKLSRWISVEERLPEKKEYVLCWYDDGFGKKWHTVGRMMDSVGNRWDLDVFHGYDEDGVTVTHWMPLPEPPKEGKK